MNNFRIFFYGFLVIGLLANTLKIEAKAQSFEDKLKKGNVGMGSVILENN